MSNATPMVPKNFGPPAKGVEDMDDDVLQGGRPSFAVLAMPNKNEWAFRYQRQDSPYQDEEGNNIPNIEVAIIKSRENLSNNFYIKYDGNAQHKPPDCFSADGQVPDQRVPEATRQNPICEGCPQKKPGSAITAAGDPTKACRDIRKIAVVPIFHLLDRKFDEYGGPMLFTITPTSLKNYTEYLDRIKAMGHKSFSVVTRMRFDPNVKHQKIVFSPYRALSDEEVAIVRELRKDPRTARVIEEEPEAGSAPPDEWDQETGEIITPAPKPKPSTSQTAQAAPAAKAPSPPAPKFTVPTKEATATKAPPPPKPGGFPATPQTVAAAMTKPATRPATVRTVQPPPVEEEQVEDEVLDDEEIVDSLDEELDNDLKRLLAGDNS
jgi:hypothetical protein